MPRRILLPSVFLSALVAVALRGADVPASGGEPVLEMPAFVITETRTNERPWRYAAAEGFEIISQAGEESTQAVFAALWRGPRLTLPPELRPKTSLPTAVIIFDQPPDRGGAGGSMGSVRLKGEQSSHWTNVIKRTLADREIFSVNLNGSFFTYSSTFRFDLRTLLALHTPAVPPWLFEAVHGTYGIYREGIGYPDRGTHTDIVSALWNVERDVVRAEQVAGQATDYFLTPPEKRRGALARPPVLLDAISDPAQLWEGGLPGDQRSPAESARWAATCALFARWGMYARDGARHDAFWRFATLACSRPVDEALVRECFGLSFEELRVELAWYLPVALVEKGVRPITPLIAPKIALRPATPAEVARLRGDFERGEASLLAPRFPDIAAKYAERAGRTLRRASAADPEDLRLAETLALYEFAAGNNGRALELLNRSTAAGQGRPRAWYLLAQLRLREVDAVAFGPGLPLTREQALPILLPLEQACHQEPAMVATYELLAELWRRCSALPAADLLARLQEGQARFPRHGRLTLAIVRACVERGEREGAVTCIESALPMTTDPALRDRLRKTREALLRAAPARSREPVPR